MNRRMKIALMLALLSLPQLSAANTYVTPPAGFTAYCATKITPECGNTINKLANTALNNYEQLKMVNEYVNERMIYQRDWVTYRKTEKWAVPNDWFGDCEDSVLKKMHMLYDMGWSEKNLKIATAFFYDHKIPDGLTNLGYGASNHAILIATYDGVDYVLDSSARVVLTVDDFTQLYGVKITGIQTTNGKWVSY